eukprot:TRINITY_DN978_c0_g1_i2.p1 TRINITY_DN978_c0_g1~~TRINITY_DN978_c0_g1_i2.p1  ORF type:complete len:895 (+),score=213.41 TRINITY_DN978_c0_g1_i2:168-2852(+)
MADAMADGTILNPGACWRRINKPNWRHELLADQKGREDAQPRQRPATRLSTFIASVYSSVNSAFRYDHDRRPKNFLTSPVQGVANNGRDNAEKDLIVHMGEEIRDDTANTSYRISSLLGRGTFGQVLRARNLKTNECVAIKIIKNDQSYYTQSQTEVRMLQMLNSQYRNADGVNVVSLLASFDCRNHLCLVFELLSLNLFELLESNGYRGLTLTTVKRILKQVLSTLDACSKLGIVHCDLKPENILIVEPQHPIVKLIDFGSACEENNPIFSYIQSRYYRAPEVLLGNHYTTMIDIWSLGCVAAELFLGLPLLPGYNDYNQLYRMIEMIGFPPKHLLDNGGKTPMYFKRYMGEACSDSDDEDDPPPRPAAGKQAPPPPPKILPSHGFKLKSEEEYYEDNPNEQRQPFKRYYYYHRLRDIIERYSWPAEIQKCEDLEKKQGLIEAEKKNRRVFLDFLHGLLHTDPYERWPAAVALQHPFMTGEEFHGAGAFHVDIAQPQMAEIKARSQPRPIRTQHPCSSISLNNSSTWGMTHHSGSSCLPTHSGVGMPSPSVGLSYADNDNALHQQSPIPLAGCHSGMLHSAGVPIAAVGHSGQLPGNIGMSPAMGQPFSTSPMPGNLVPQTSMPMGFPSASVGSSAPLGTTPTMSMGRPIPIPTCGDVAQSLGNSAPSFQQWMAGGAGSSASGTPFAGASGPLGTSLHGSSPLLNDHSQPMPIGHGPGSAGAAGPSLQRYNSGSQGRRGGGGGHAGGNHPRNGYGGKHGTPPHSIPFGNQQGNSPGPFSGSSPELRPPMYSQPMTFAQRSTHSTPGGGSTPTSNHYLSPGGSYQMPQGGMPPGQPQMQMHSGAHPVPKVVQQPQGGMGYQGYPMHAGTHAPQTGRSPSSYDGWTENVPWEDGN